LQDIIVKIENVSKRYPGVLALDDVTFNVKKGEVHALCGENGAGKSTLIKCIMGVETMDGGNIKIDYDGEWVQNTNAIDAQKHGVYANYQNVMIAPDLSIAENYFLGNQPTKNGFVDWSAMYTESQKIIDKFDMNVDPSEKIRELPLALQAMVTISKISINDNIKLVILDEPTALLENEKVETLFHFIRELKQKGASIIYISHRLEEIMEIGDTVTILKDGCVVDTLPVSQVDKDVLIRKMVGREMSDMYKIEHMLPQEELLRVQNFSDGKNFENISFNLYKGEILGFFGLVGAGRSEVMRSLMGVDGRTEGDVYIRGEKVDINDPAAALKLGMGFLTEDRKADGCALGLTVKHNINMSSFDMISKFGFVNLKSETERAAAFKNDMNIRTPSLEQLVGNLSGGNQQKVVISKILCRDPEILIFDEPTVGIDVGAKEEIYKIIEKLTSQGRGIILISSYLPEVMGLSDRLIVMAQGTITAEFDRNSLKTLSEEDILRKASIE
jgi:ribose transport system ATP-binding protein